MLESPLSNRDAERFGLRILREAGFEVLVWNVAPIYLPNSEMEWYEPAADFDVTRFSSMAEFKTACESLGAQDVVIMMVGFYRGQLHSHLEMLKAVSSSPALRGAVVGAHLPDMSSVHRARQKAGVTNSVNVLGRQRAFFGHALFSQKWLMELYRYWIHRTTGVRPFDAIWVGATPERIHPVLVGSRTRIEYVHVFDFDLTLGLTPTAPEAAKYLVLIDSLGPLHPDYVTHSMNMDAYRPESYFGELCGILRQIESWSGLPITIAAHPRAEVGTLESLYENRQVVYEDTVNCTANATAVLLTEASTAVNFAVVMRRPLLLISLACSEPGGAVGVGIMSTLLKSRVFESVQTSEEWKIPTVDVAAYNSYKVRYIKRPGTLELPFWQVVANGLQGDIA